MSQPKTWGVKLTYEEMELLLRATYPGNIEMLAGDAVDADEMQSCAAAIRQKVSDRLNEIDAAPAVS
jgi:hypothetical protein